MIYGFRGADVDAFFNTINKIPHKSHVLGQNYRSTPEIVEAAQSLIKYNSRPDEKQIFSMQESGERVAILQNRNPVSQADKIAKTIAGLYKTGEIKYGDIAVLYRNSFISRNLEDSFCRHHIPYDVVGGMSFYRRQEIKTLVNFLTFFENPENVTALSSIINIPKNGLGKKTIEKIVNYNLQEYATYAIITLSRAIDIMKGIEQKDPKIWKKLKPFVDRCEKVNAYMEDHDNVADLLDYIVTTFDYGNYLRVLDEETCEDRMMNVIEMKNMAMGYASLQEFLEDVLTVNPDTESEDAADTERDAVQLMTMHASKGLEFRVVFIVSANQGIIPSWRCESEKDIQEERRLFYVAMTRAKENLVISSTDTTLQRGRVVPAHPSSFIAQIDERFVVKPKE